MILDLLQKRVHTLQQELINAKQAHQICLEQLEQAKANLHKINGHIQEASYLAIEATNLQDCDENKPQE